VSYKAYCHKLADMWNAHQGWLRSLGLWPDDRCFYCGKVLLKDDNTRDHIVPRMRKGFKTVSCCYDCNNAKGDRLLNEFRACVFRSSEERFFGELVLNVPSPKGADAELDDRWENIKKRAIYNRQFVDSGGVRKKEPSK